MLGASMPPPIATQVKISGTLQTPRRIIRSTVSKLCDVVRAGSALWMPVGGQTPDVLLDPPGSAGIVISR